LFKTNKKMKKVIIFFLFLTVFSGCKKDNKESSNKEVVVTEKKENKLIVEVEYISDKVDVVQCVFNKIELSNINQMGLYIITNKIKNSKEYKTLKFEMFGDYVTSLVQLKFGDTPKELYINKINFTFYDNSVIIDGAELDKYFAMNEYIDFDPVGKLMVTKKINNKHYPTITLRSGFINRLFDL